MGFNSGRPEFNWGRPVLYLSTSEGLSEVATACGCWSVSLKTLSMTESSVLVVSSPQKAHQSLTTIPADSTSLPLFTVPAWGVRWGGGGGGGGRLVKYTLLVWAYVRRKKFLPRVELGAARRAHLGLQSLSSDVPAAPAKHSTPHTH